MTTGAVRTPEERFEGLPGFAFRPSYREALGLRLAHLDEGAGPPVLFLHGEPTWSFLWRKVLPPVLDAGFRCIVPDLPGFGRSDIPAPGPPHRVVPQCSTFLLLPRVSPKVAGLRHPNRAPKDRYTSGWQTTSPAKPKYSRKPRTSRPPWVIAVSFRSMRSSQLPPGEPRTPPQQRPLLTIDEAATYLNVPARWVADAVRQRKIRCTRIGKHIRFRVEHLDELVADGEQPVTSDVIPIQRSRARSKLYAVTAATPAGWCHR